jgi:hypothetical protein
MAEIDQQDVVRMNRDTNTPTVDRNLLQMKLYDLPAVPRSAAMDADTLGGDGVTGDDAPAAPPPTDQPAVDSIPPGEATEEETE